MHWYTCPLFEYYIFYAITMVTILVMLSVKLFTISFSTQLRVKISPRLMLHVAGMWITRAWIKVYFIKVLFRFNAYLNGTLLRKICVFDVLLNIWFLTDTCVNYTMELLVTLENRKNRPLELVRGGSLKLEGLIQRRDGHLLLWTDPSFH